MKINYDVVNGGLKLHLSTKIAFILNTESHDNKIKTWIVLKIF